MPFVKRLTRIGGSTGLIIDLPLLQQLELSTDSEVEVSLENHALVIRPHRDATATARRLVTKRRRLLTRLAK